MIQLAASLAPDERRQKKNGRARGPCSRAGAPARPVRMRKRKYGQLNQKMCVQDTMVEDICRMYAPPPPLPELGACPEAQIHNLVGTAKINCSVGPLDLFSISKLLPNSVYDKQKFAAITIRIAEPACTVLLFTSGKMVLTGCRTFLACVAASHEVVQLLKFGVSGSNFSLHECHIQNIVGNGESVLSHMAALRQRSVVSSERVVQPVVRAAHKVSLLTHLCRSGSHASTRSTDGPPRVASSKFCVLYLPEEHVPRAYLSPQLVASGAFDIF